MTLRNIENYPNLKKDVESNAVLNNDEMEYLAFLEKRQQRQEQQHKIKCLEKEINHINNKLDDMFALLSNLVNVKGMNEK